MRHCAPEKCFMAGSTTQTVGLKAVRQGSSPEPNAHPQIRIVRTVHRSLDRIVTSKATVRAMGITKAATRAIEFQQVQRSAFLLAFGPAKPHSPQTAPKKFLISTTPTRSLYLQTSLPARCARWFSGDFDCAEEIPTSSLVAMPRPLKRAT